MLPEGWVSVPLEQLTDSSAPIRYGVVQIGEDVEGGVPIVPIKKIRKIGQSALHRAARAIEAKYKASRVQGGDILLSVKGTIGEVGIVPDGFEGNIAREIARIRPNRTCDASYLALQLDAPHTQKRIDRATVGSTRREFSIHAVRKFSIPLPPLSEQRKIADIISTWDRAIETTEALLASARTQKRALMQTLLTGKRRFPEFEGQDWRDVRLDQVAKIVKGKQKSKATLCDKGDYPVINGGISPSGYTDEWNAEAGTITISEGGNSCGYVNLFHEPFWSGGHCYTLESLSIRRDFLFHSLKFREEKIMSLRVGSGLPNIQKKAVSGVMLALPTNVEQQRIEQVLNSAHEEEMALEKKIEKLRAEKKALMQQLLTGKRRVQV